MSWPRWPTRWPGTRCPSRPAPLRTTRWTTPPGTGRGQHGPAHPSRPGADHHRLPAPDLLPERAVRAAGHQHEHHRPGDRRDPPTTQRTPHTILPTTLRFTTTSALLDFVS